MRLQGRRDEKVSTLFEQAAGARGRFQIPHVHYEGIGVQPDDMREVPVSLGGLLFGG